MGLRHRAKRARRLSAAGQPHNATAITDWAAVQQIKRAASQVATVRHNAERAVKQASKELSAMLTAETDDGAKIVTFAPPHRQRRRTGRG